MILKFVEGSAVRQGPAGFAHSPAKVGPKRRMRLARANLTDRDLPELLASVREAVAEEGGRAQPLFPLEPEVFDLKRMQVEERTGEELADLNLYYAIEVPKGRMPTLVERLNANPTVEVAYPAPLPVSPSVDIPPVTPDYEPQQFHLLGSDMGVDAKFAWTLAGGTGEGVQVVDIERDWNFSHEDLPSPTFISGSLSGIPAERHHGTAAIGLVVAERNGYGVTGVAPDASWAAVGSTGVTTAQAVYDAAFGLSWGDIILIEEQLAGPEWDPSNCPTGVCDCVQYGLVPVEFFTAEYDAIKWATANGVVVVEPAANGSLDLDAAPYAPIFQRSFRDSGAIFVGAGVKESLEPACYTNFGSRLDVQAPAYVTTTGYGDLTPAGTDQDQYYTTQYQGTSAAAPQIAGAAAILQSRRTARGFTRMDSETVRSTLRSYSSRQPTPVSKRIGPLPQLRRALGNFQPPAAGGFGATRTPTQNEVWSTFNVGYFRLREFPTAGGFTHSTIAPQSTLGAYADFVETPSGDLFAFLVGVDGRIHKYKWSQYDDWRGHEVLGSPGLAVAGSPMAAAVRDTQTLSVFFFATDGSLKVFETSSSSGLGGWSLHTLSPTSTAVPGAALTVGKRSGQVHVFFVGNDLALKLVADTWLGWSSVETISATGLAPTNASVVAKHVGGYLNVWVVGMSQELLHFWDNGWGWSGPTALTPPEVPRDARLDAAIVDGLTAVFYVTDSGRVRTLASSGLGAWNIYNITSEDVAFPGACVRAVESASGSDVVLYLIGHAGLSSASSPDGVSWSTLTKLPDP